MSDVTLARGHRPEPFGSPYVFALAIIDGPDLPAIHRIVAAETTIGRGSEAGFALSDPSISKRHAIVQIQGPIYTLIDLESLNGTFLNGRRLVSGGRERLKHLDEIQVGDTRILFTAGRFRTAPTIGGG
jgi:pSer/pThr/pTyr-binding forkhead associated (FHA) protein